ncbi:hypothetical protein SEETLT22_01515 [Salmonella enterica subsp. enterica serovar Typhimurium str. LT2-4]|nr:hypothetical protein SEETLT22_01515 [Salmonella enterica subsp. enterica serovar Typhimurium str. LT2-4]
MASNKFERWSGLSPLARGTLDVDEELLNRCRFYPRWRGEHSATWPTGTTRSGLSPLARGTQMTKSEIFTKARFIPAGAGNTNGHSKSNGSGTVYPRWRGEHESGGYIVI